MKADIQKQEIAVKLSGIKKRYKLGQIGGGTLRGDIESWWAKVRGKEDPHSIIGEDSSRLVGQSFMALDGVDLTVYKGETLGIIGRNGAGKSTLLKLLSRVTAPTAGEIDIYGRITSMLEVGTGFSGEMTGRENVYMNGAILGMTKAEIDAKMDAIIEFSEVGKFIDTPVKRYSSGMYVKLAFSVAAHLDSDIMIMDEVLAVGDMVFQKKCLTRMREAASNEGRTVLYVSHNMNTIRALCDRCIVMDQGKIIFNGDVEEAISIYINAEYCEAVYMDVSQQVLPYWMVQPAVRFMSFKFLGKETNVFSLSEPISLQIRWKNLTPVNKALMRVEIITLEEQPVATYMLSEFYSGAEDADGEFKLELDTAALMEGKYRTRYVFYYLDSTGEGLNIGYAEGLSFAVVTPPSDTPLVWDTQHWGSIRLPDPKVLS